MKIKRKIDNKQKTKHRFFKTNQSKKMTYRFSQKMERTGTELPETFFGFVYCLRNSVKELNDYKFEILSCLDSEMCNELKGGMFDVVLELRLIVYQFSLNHKTNFHWDFTGLDYFLAIGEGIGIISNELTKNSWKSLTPQKVDEGFELFFKNSLLYMGISFLKKVIDVIAIMEGRKIRILRKTKNPSSLGFDDETVFEAIDGIVVAHYINKDEEYGNKNKNENKNENKKNCNSFESCMIRGRKEKKIKEINCIGFHTIYEVDYNGRVKTKMMRDEL
jgi:hypothetical protein